MEVKGLHGADAPKTINSQRPSRQEVWSHKMSCYRTSAASSQDNRSYDSFSLDSVFDLSMPVIKPFCGQEKIETRIPIATTFFLVHIVTEALEELQMVKAVLSNYVEPAADPTTRFKSVRQRFGKKDSEGEQKVGMEYTDLHKLQNDVALIMFLLETLIQEEQNYSTPESFREYVRSIVLIGQEEENLFQEIQQKLDILTYLKSTIRNFKKKCISTIKDLDESVETQLKVAQERGEQVSAEIEYVGKWQSSRLEQNLIRLQMQEKNFTSTSELMRSKAASEARCHELMEAYIHEEAEDNMSRIEIMMDDYDCVLESKEADIMTIQTKIEKNRQDIEDLQREYDRRVEAMEEWNETKRQKREAEELLKKMNVMAIKIQTWWRSTMMRLKLGPYKPKKSKKSKNKKKAKK